MKYLLVALLALSGAVEAATQLTLICTPPIKRVDDSPMLATDVAAYSFSGPGVNSAAQQTGQYVLPIAKGQTIKAGTIFGCFITDIYGLPSPAAVVPLNADATNAPAKPLAPTVSITVQ